MTGILGLLRHGVELELLRKSDVELLSRFLVDRDEAAFAAIVYRHGAMVSRVCSSVLRNKADVEDASQVTFLVLAQKVGQVRDRGSLASWLHGVALRTARKLYASIARRRESENPLPPLPSPAIDELSVREATAILHEELDALPARYKDPLVLCYLQGKTHDEGAAELGWTHTVFRGRLERARKQLHAQLERRGLALLTALFAGLLAETRPSLAGTFVRVTAQAAAAGRLSAASRGLISPRVSQLAREVLRTTTLGSLKYGLTLVVMTGLAVGGYLAYRPHSAPPDAPATPLLAGGQLTTSLNVGAAPRVTEKVNDKTSDRASDAQKLAGAWLPDALTTGKQNRVQDVWKSQLTLTADTFCLSRYMGVSKDLRGRFLLDPAADPKVIDLQVDELDLSEVWTGVKMPAWTVRGIYKLDADRFTVCFPIDGRRERPISFDVQDKSVAILTLVRAGAGFTKIPEQVAVKVIYRDGKPASRATVFGLMSHRESDTASSSWQFEKLVKAGADGTAKVPYEQFQFLAARDESGKQIGHAPVSPVSLRSGTATVVLRPACRVTGSVGCEELREAGNPVGWTKVDLICAGHTIASYASSEGHFEFQLAPGMYTLHAYGADLCGKDVTVTVPDDRNELPVEPIILRGSRLLLLEGKPAPELEGVIAWKGEGVKLADLKGKYVLLVFWGYWCRSGVLSMPTLIELQEKYADKGLAIVGIHVDQDGEVDDLAKYDDKIAPIRKNVWQDKELPFPVALTSGKLVDSDDGEPVRGGAAAQYGILGYPTTILIDRSGKVVGACRAQDVKQAAAELEKLLGDKK